MSMFGFLKGKKSTPIEEFENKAFSAWGVSNPDNAKRLRLRMAFVLAAASEIHMKMGQRSAPIIEKIQIDVAKASQDIPVRVSDLFDVNVPSHSINYSMERFLSVASPAGVNLEGSTQLNGLAAIYGLFEAFGQEGVSWISDRSQGPFGPLGAASLLMHDLSVGGSNKSVIAMTDVPKAYTQALLEITK